MMLPTSVTIAPVVAASAAATTGAIVGIGVQTTTRSAPRTASSSEVAGEKPPSPAARAVVAGSASHPDTVAPARAAAIATEVPISPVPRTATRPIGSWERAAVIGRRPSAGVISECLRTVEVHVGDLVEGPVGVEVHEDPDHRRHRTLDRDLLGAHEWYATESHPPGRLRGEGGAEVLRRREHDAHELLRVDLVALQHGRKQPLGGSEQRVTVVRWHADGPARRTKPHENLPRERRLEAQRLPVHDVPERHHLVV